MNKKSEIETEDQDSISIDLVKKSFLDRGCISAKGNCSVGSVWRCSVVLSVFLLAAQAASGQLSENWFAVEGGGGTSAGAQLSLTGTVGQPVAGRMTGGGYILNGGFLSFVAALPPRLTMNHASGFVTICWPYPSSGYVLAQSDSLSTIWTPIPIQPSQIDPLTLCMTLQAGTTLRFYRLQKSVL